jgi:adenylate kinase
MGINANSDRTAWLNGGDASCELPRQTQAFPRRLVLLGAPGVGKGTQAELLTERLGVCHLSTGDIFRNAKNSAATDVSPAIKCALDRMRRGELVTDEIVLSLVAERAGCLRCDGGFLLDGFPRTLTQAQALAKVLSGTGIKLDAVLNYDLPLERIITRLSGRRTCLKCQAVFHVKTRPPKRPGICDQCGSTLTQREDDRAEAIRVRMEAYQHSTAPLADFYRECGLLISIAAYGSPDEILERSLSALNARFRRPGDSRIQSYTQFAK